LWDLLGKALEVPVYQLFGGKFRDSIRLYADGHAGTIDAEGHHVEAGVRDPQVREREIRAEMAQGARDALDRGFGALKFDVDDIHHPAKHDYWNWSLNNREIDDIVGRVAAVRDAIGYDVDLAIDIHGRYDVPSAVQVARALEPFRLMWLEEPVAPDVPDGLAQVRRMTTIPICAGENVYTRFGIFDLIKREAVDIVMPDLAKFGGLMDGIRVAGIAELNGLPFAPHNVSGPIGTVAMAHVCAAIPNFLILEFHGMDLDYWGDLVSYAAGDVIQEGAVPLSDAPGWGIELNDEVVRAHLHHRMADDYFGEPL
jgi:galactonate dehydratase